MNLIEAYRSWKAHRHIRALAQTVIGVNSAFAFIDQPLAENTFYITSADELFQMGAWHLPWYKGPPGQPSGYQYDSSRNWRLDEFVREIVEGRALPPPELEFLMASIDAGVNRDLHIIAAYDAALGKIVIVDGCKRSIALSWWLATDAAKLVPLIGDGRPQHSRVKVSIFISPYMRYFFASDFLRLRYPPPTPPMTVVNLNLGSDTKSTSENPSNSTFGFVSGP